MVLATLLVACSQSDPETEIRARLDEAVAAAEQRDTGFFRDLISQDYRDSRGGRRDDVINRVRGGFLRYPRIRVASQIQDVELQGTEKAQVVVVAGLTGDQGNLLAGLSADLYRFELDMVRDDDGRWRIIAGDWSSVRTGQPPYSRLSVGKRRQSGGCSRGG